MADTPEENRPVPEYSGVIASRIGEEEARDTVRRWLGSDLIPFIPEEKIRFGKAVLIYYPFWRYIREDGGENKIIYRPACGTLLTGLQNLRRDDSDAAIQDVPPDAKILPATVASSVYLPELHGIARSEELIGIPLWLISYKVKHAIYMVEVDAASGVLYPEWHPIKEPVNWKKTALTAFLPMLLLSLVAVYFNPWIFLLVILILIVFLYQSEMLGIINLKEKEEKNGS